MAKTYTRKTGRPYKQSKPQSVPGTFKTGFLSTMDRRTDLARTLKANYEEIAEDLGGLDELSHIKRALIERYVWLQAIVQTLEQDMATKRDIDKATLTEMLNRWTSSTNSLINLAKTLGIDRKNTRKNYSDLIEIETEGNDGQG